VAPFSPSSPGDTVMEVVPPGTAPAQASRAEVIDPGFGAPRLPGSGEAIARIGHARAGDPAFAAQIAGQAPTQPQPSHPVASFAAQLVDQTKPEAVTTTGNVVASASPTPPAADMAPKDMVAPQAVETITPARLTEGLAGSEFRPDAGVGLATTPQRAAPTPQDVPPPSHPRAAPPHAATTQVAVSVARAVDDGVDRIAIKLQPPELGRIDVRLDFGADGRVQAMVLADRPATLEILRNDARELERALAGAGLETASGGLSFGLRQHANGNGQGGAHGFAPQPGRLPSDDAPPEDGRVPVSKHVLSAAPGRLDIQV
jgi:hypothetical protein